MHVCVPLEKRWTTRASLSTMHYGCFLLASEHRGRSLSCLPTITLTFERFVPVLREGTYQSNLEATRSDARLDFDHRESLYVRTDSLRGNAIYLRTSLANLSYRCYCCLRVCVCACVRV